MRQTVALVLVLWLPTACSHASYVPQPEHGRLTASIDGHRFESRGKWGGFLASYDTTLRVLMITGQEVQRTLGMWPTLTLTLRCDRLPPPGTYVVGGGSDPVNAYLFWGMHYLSDPADSGTIVLETIDTAKAVIRGHFAFHMQRPNGGPAGPTVQGYFDGRLGVHGYPRHIGRGWAPILKHGC